MKPKPKRKHFPDWLFYLLSIIVVLSVSGTIKFYNAYDGVSKSLASVQDSLNFNKKILKQGLLNSIFNNDSIPYVVEQMDITYLDEDGNLKHCRTPLNENIEPTNLFQIDRKKLSEPWNGKCLYFSFRLKGTYREGYTIYHPIVLLAGSYGEFIHNETLKIIN